MERFSALCNWEPVLWLQEGIATLTGVLKAEGMCTQLSMGKAHVVGGVRAHIRQVNSSAKHCRCFADSGVSESWTKKNPIFLMRLVALAYRDIRMTWVAVVTKH